VVELCKLLEEKRGIGRTLGWQLLRAGTSVGANVEEAQAAQSRADFINKNAIALKEARETDYWLRLLDAVNGTSRADLAKLRAEASALTRILGAIIVSAKKGIRKSQNPYP
jgi:four helix bundle protein